MWVDLDIRGGCKFRYHFGYCQGLSPFIQVTKIQPCFFSFAASRGGKVTSIGQSSWCGDEQLIQWSSKILEKLMSDERSCSYESISEIMFWEACGLKASSGFFFTCAIGHDSTWQRKGAPDKGHTTPFLPSEAIHYFPNFWSYFGMKKSISLGIWVLVGFCLSNRN